MIDKHILDFNENLIGLRDFVELIDPFLNEKLQEHDKHVKPIIFSAIIEDVLNNKVDLDDDDKEEFFKLKKKVNANLEESFSEVPDIKLNKKENGDVETISIRLKSSNNDLPKHFENVIKSRKHIELLYTNSLISALSSVELFFSRLLHFFYNKYPESAGIQKKTMTLAELKNFDSIGDAEKHLIDIKIDEVLRGNFQSWEKLLKSELSLKLGYLGPIMDELVEIYQRRNLFVHNGGIVNSIYLSKVNLNLRKEISLKDKLIVDKEYLNKAICTLQKAFILIGAELWKNLKPEDLNRGKILTNIVYENLLHSRWDICEGLCYFLLKDAKIDPTDKVIAQINYWLCKKEKGEYRDIEQEINKTNFSDKKEIFQLGLYALRGQTDRIINILPTILEANQVKVEDIEEFPILREFRDTSEYANFKLKSKFFKEIDKKISEKEILGEEE